MVLKNINNFFKNEGLRKKFYVTIGIVVLYKFLSALPVPGVNIDALAQIKKFLEINQGLSFFSALMGGGLESFSVILMGLSPYINAVIIIQLLAVIIPYLENLKKEGEAGQKKIDKYTKLLTVPLAFAQSYGMIILLNTLVAQSGGNIVNTSDFWGTVLPAMIFITAGTMFLVWLGEMISESGIGNGSSIIIFAGVLAGVPQHIMSYISVGNWGLLIGLAIATLIVIFIIIKFTEGYRKVTLIYTRTGRSEQSYFPIRINQAGMVPIIFAVSIVTFPSLIGQILSTRGSGKAIDFGKMLVEYFSMNNPSWVYIIVYFLLVLGFSFFYVSIVFNTEEISENIQKRGGYIPGVRPGRETAEYFEKTSNHLNLFGGSFLAIIAVFPYIITKVANQFGLFDTSGASRIDFLISGAGLIIVVSTILDLIRRIDTELKSYDYKKFY
ncbi:MAG: preprotein translocase subunit SecY [Candidatus Gracilibacteria bacterium]|nr:preprotein translocase subunit SecY [Candidatus Gracilibacteria bacterium]MDD3119837.1 preprotein translocase subunit SecY [Candidatus Gracilibacteria bacterium]MDD4530816.1 preprotein translocase subunit SecY [Candidatus Gracilibacteria bacterium]